MAELSQWVYDTPAKKTKRKWRIWEMTSYAYILPLLVILIGFYVIPIVMSFALSFTKYNIMQPPTYIGAKNYMKLFTDETFIKSIQNTFLFMICVVPIQTIGALLMAVWLTAWKRSWLARFVQSVMFIPVISSMILIGIVWRILLNGDTSPLNMVVDWLGFAPDWLGDSDIALFTLMGISIWKNIGYFMVLYIAGLMEIPAVYHEAAKVDGANIFQEFFAITIPCLRKTTVLVVFLGIIWSFQIFDLVYTLTGGGPGNATMTMVVHIFNLNFKQFNTGYAMTVANVLFLINATFVIVQKRFLKSDS